MKYIEPPDDRTLPVLELTRRNLEGLLEKLDDPKSLRMLVDGENKIVVKAVENEAHYANRPPGVMYTHGREH